jgi:IS5 family transposase
MTEWRARRVGRRPDVMRRNRQGVTMGLLATARGRIRKRIVNVVTVTARLAFPPVPAPDLRAP